MGKMRKSAADQYNTCQPPKSSISCRLHLPTRDRTMHGIPIFL